MLFFCESKMSSKELMKVAEKLQAVDGWALHSSSIAMMAGYDDGYLTVALARACKSGLLQRLSRGFYRFPRLKMPAHHLEQLANWLRPNEFFYLSLESALSDAGVISQVPNRLTFVTKGRSYTYSMPGVGCIEFIHSSVPEDVLREGVVFNAARNIRVASVPRALADLQRIGRSLDLVRDEHEPDDPHYGLN